MSGYNGFSMSNNAVSAYENGLVPASKISGVPAELVKRFARYEEWHHCSKNFNVVQFYLPEYVRAIFGLQKSNLADANPVAVAALAAWKNKSTAGPTVHVNCTVEWLEWGGTKKHPSATEMSESGCTVSVKGATATITLANGRVFTKRLATRGFKFLEAK